MKCLFILAHLIFIAWMSVIRHDKGRKERRGGESRGPADFSAERERIPAGKFIPPAAL